MRNYILLISLLAFYPLPSAASSSNETTVYGCKAHEMPSANTFKIVFYQNEGELAADLDPVNVKGFPTTRVTFPSVKIISVPVPKTTDGKPHPKGDSAHFVSSGSINISGVEYSFGDLWVHPKDDLTIMQPTIEFGDRKILADCNREPSGEKAIQS